MMRSFALMSGETDTTGYRPPRFEVEVEDADGAVVVRLIGELDLVSEPVLADALEQADGRPLRVDLSELAFMDSTGLRALLGLQREHTDVKLRGPLQPAVQRLLELTQTLTILPFEDA
jgi:anti-anti-sigma factor